MAKAPVDDKVDQAPSDDDMVTVEFEDSYNIVVDGMACTGRPGTRLAVRRANLVAVLGQGATEVK